MTGKISTSPFFPTGIFEQQGHTFVVRGFYRGIDGRALSDPDIEIPYVPFDTLLCNYLTRYVVFGDLDFDNPGNIVFARHSSLTPEVIIHIGTLPSSLSPFSHTPTLAHFRSPALLPNLSYPPRLLITLFLCRLLSPSQTARTSCQMSVPCLSSTNQDGPQVPPSSSFYLFSHTLLLSSPYFLQNRLPMPSILPLFSRLSPHFPPIQGEPIPGTLEWRREMCRLHTPERFFKRLIHGENPLLSYMRRSHGHQELMSVEIPEKFLRWEEVDAERVWDEEREREMEKEEEGDLPECC